MDNSIIENSKYHGAVVVMSFLITLSGCTDKIVGTWDSDSDCATSSIQIEEELEGEVNLVFGEEGDCIFFDFDTRVDVIDRNSQYELQVTPSDAPDWEHPETMDCSMDSREDELACTFQEWSMIFMREGGTFD